MKLPAIKLIAATGIFTICIACNNETKNEAASGSMENTDARRDTSYDTSTMDSGGIPPYDSDMDTTGNAAKMQ